MKPTYKQMSLLTAMAKDRCQVAYCCDGLEAMKTGFCNTDIAFWAKLAGLTVRSARGVFGTLVKAGWVQLDEDNFRKNPSMSDYWDMSAFTEEGAKVYEENGGEWFEEGYRANSIRLGNQ